MSATPRSGAGAAAAVQAAAAVSAGVLRRRSWLAALSGAWLLPAWANGAATPTAFDAPNIVDISPRLVTSGQPSAQALQTLADQGFQAVVYLAPSTVASAVQDEPALLARQGIAFFHLPIPFDAPDQAHVERFNATLAGLAERRVLVHCEINMRASCMVFLYRVLQLHQPPAEAYDAVARVWSPRGAWRRLIVAQLARQPVPFEPD
jgi:protein tyrosine phosphatase (PTP) superfamily phosphohydrolase (DUF442 family)